MNIFTFGSRFYGGQIDRIDNGFIELGHNVNPLGPPDFIYSNDNSHHNQAIEKWLAYDKHPKLILNVLDVPYWIPSWPKIHEEWTGQLGCADKVTCISEAVQKDIVGHFLINAQVIYNPIKPVYYIPNVEKDIVCLFVGRCNAPNKRKNEILWPLYQSLVPYFGKDCMHFIGSENSGFGVNHGIVSDEELNLLYNRSLFGMISSSFEGENLPMLEMICANVKPIIARDMSTAQELGIPELLCDPTPQAFFYKIKEVGDNLEKYDKICDSYAQKYFQKFSGKSIASNIISVYNSI